MPGTFSGSPTPILRSSRGQRRVSAVSASTTPSSREQRNGLTTIRLRGGLPERMRFFLGTDPAITRKRSIEGAAVKTNARLRVTSIRPLGMVMRMYDITTGTGDFIANGVVSHNCFARPTHKYLDFDAGRDFEREIVVKVNAPEVLRAELARPSWKREHVALGTNTDPYQWVEGRYRLMEGIWEALRDAANPCSVLTKSPLLLRDLPLMLQIAAADELQRVPVDPDARREGLAGDRAAHAQPARTPGGGGRAQPRGDPDGRADRAADARDQRRPAPGRAAARAGQRPPARRASAAWPCTCAARCARDLHGLAASPAPRPRAALRGALPPRRLRAQRERERLARMVRRGGRRAGSGVSRPSGGPAARPTHGPHRGGRAQQALFLREPAEAQRLSRWPASILRVMSSEPPSLHDARGELRGEAREDRAGRAGRGRDVDLAAVALDRAPRRRGRRPRGCACRPRAAASRRTRRTCRRRG